MCEGAAVLKQQGMDVKWAEEVICCDAGERDAV